MLSLKQIQYSNLFAKFLEWSRSHIKALRLWTESRVCCISQMQIDKPQREYKRREKYISMVGKIAHVYIRDVSLTSPFPSITLSTLAKDASHLLIIALAKYRTILNSFHQWPLADRNGMGYRAEPVGKLCYDLGLFGAVSSPESKCHCLYISWCCLQSCCY